MARHIVSKRGLLSVLGKVKKVIEPVVPGHCIFVESKRSPGFCFIYTEAGFWDMYVGNNEYSYTHVAEWHDTARTWKWVPTFHGTSVSKDGLYASIHYSNDIDMAEWAAFDYSRVDVVWFVAYGGVLPYRNPILDGYYE